MIGGGSPVVSTGRRKIFWTWTYCQRKRNVWAGNWNIMRKLQEKKLWRKKISNTCSTQTAGSHPWPLTYTAKITRALFCLKKKMSLLHISAAKKVPRRKYHGNSQSKTQFWNKMPLQFSKQNTILKNNFMNFSKTKHNSETNAMHFSKTKHNSEKKCHCNSRSKTQFWKTISCIFLKQNKFWNKISLQFSKQNTILRKNVMHFSKTKKILRKISLQFSKQNTILRKNFMNFSKAKHNSEKKCHCNSWSKTQFWEKMSLQFSKQNTILKKGMAISRANKIKN